MQPHLQNPELWHTAKAGDLYPDYLFEGKPVPAGLKKCPECARLYKPYVMRCGDKSTICRPCLKSAMNPGGNDY